MLAGNDLDQRAGLVQGDRANSFQRAAAQPVMVSAQQ